MSNGLVVVSRVLWPNWSTTSSSIGFALTKAFIGLGAGAPAWFLTSELVPIKQRYAVFAMMSVRVEIVVPVNQHRYSVADHRAAHVRLSATGSRALLLHHARLGLGSSNRVCPFTVALLA